MNRYSRCNTLEDLYTKLVDGVDELARLRALDPPASEDEMKFVDDAMSELGDEIVVLESGIHIPEEVIV